MFYRSYFIYYSLLLRDYYYPNCIAEDSGVQRVYIISTLSAMGKSSFLKICLTQTQMPMEVEGGSI